LTNLLQVAIGPASGLKASLKLTEVEIQVLVYKLRHPVEVALGDRKPTLPRTQSAPTFKG